MAVDNTYSAVISIYNKKDYIRRSLSSVLNQELSVNEVILVDDGSTDNWEKEVEDLLEDPRVRVVYQKNSGVSVARNRGARESKSEFVCFLDADDEWLSNFIFEIDRLISVAPNASAFTVRHSRVSVDGKIQKQKISLPDGFCGVVENFLDEYRKGYGLIHSSCICIRREVFDSYEGFPPGARKSQDIYFWLQLGLHETMAFNNTECVLRHDDGSGAALRAGVISHHIKYYLVDGHIKNVSNPHLHKFIKSNALIMMLAEKNSGNYDNAKIIQRSTKALGLTYFIKSYLLFCFPKKALSLGRKAQLFLRK